MEPAHINSSLVVRTFTSRAQIPVEGASVTVTQPSSEGRHKVLAVEITDENGFTKPIPLPAPPRIWSDKPGIEHPYASYDVWVEHPDYKLVVVRDVQLFSGVETMQEVILHTLPEHPTSNEETESYNITPQPL